MQYEIGYHSSEIECPHVALVDDEGERDEIFDVRLYHLSSPVAEYDPAFMASRDGLARLVARANRLLARDNATQGAEIERYRAALERLASPNRDVPASGRDAVEMAAFARAALDTSTASVVSRLRADLAFHQAAAAQITRDELDIDTAPEGAYSIESDTAESYHRGRVEAITDVLSLLAGEERTLYSETEVF